MHRRLHRLLEVHLGPGRQPERDLRALLRDVDEDYRRADQDRGALQHALDLVGDLTRRTALAPPRRPSPARARLTRLTRRTFQQAPFAGLLCGPALEIIAWNHAAETFFGWGAADALGRELPALLFPDRDELATARELRAVLARGEVEQALRVSASRSGEARLAEWTIIPLHEGPGVLAGAAMLVREPYAAPERHAAAIQGAGDCGFEWDLVTGRLWLSEGWTQLSGDGTPTGAPSDWLGRVHAAEREPLDAAVQAHLAGATDRFESEHRLRHGPDGWRWVLARGRASRDAAGKALRFSGTFTDVTRRREESERALHDALHDPLTRLPNRALFLDLVKRSFARSRRRDGYRFAVVFLDLDRFKAVNDGLGHAAGDEVLSQMARRLQGCLREGDTLARHGGDEFTILLDDVKGAADAQIVADRIHQATAVPFQVSGQEVFCTVSAGVALSSAAYGRPEDLLLDADTAMYRAKALGRARTAVFDPSMRERTPQLLTLEADLRRALLRKEFRIHYLPVVEVASGRIQGLEALIRWAHPERGLVPPQDFVPFAEETGLILPIGEWLLRQAGREFRQCRSAVPDGEALTLHVNLSSKQLLDGALLSQIDEVMYEHQLRPRDLTLELNETALAAHDRSAERIAELRGRGVRLCMDDFGDGQSSISSLHRFTFDALKIDRSLFEGGSPRGRAPEIVKSIVSLAREMGTPVVAEGVQSAEQLYFLRELGCAGAQGFYFSPPVDGTAAASLVASGPTW
jgi:diguanylate cyclase (GGDEF)-like protein/PAS domain S-box-containing protein